MQYQPYSMSTRMKKPLFVQMPRYTKLGFPLRAHSQTHTRTHTYLFIIYVCHLFTLSVYIFEHAHICIVNVDIYMFIPLSLFCM